MVRKVRGGPRASNIMEVRESFKKELSSRVLYAAVISRKTKTKKYPVDSGGFGARKKPIVGE